MLELKNELTGQNHEDGIKQWKQDRYPKEPLFRFKRNLVYFSVGNEKVSMTTRLRSDKTFFLPFNKGIDNPVNPSGGFRTHYLWEETLQPNCLLDLIENFVHIREEIEKEYDPQKQKVVDKKKEKKETEKKKEEEAKSKAETAAKKKAEEEAKARIIPTLNVA